MSTHKPTCSEIDVQIMLGINRRIYGYASYYDLVSICSLWRVRYNAFTMFTRDLYSQLLLAGYNFDLTIDENLATKDKTLNEFARPEVIEQYFSKAMKEEKSCSNKKRIKRGLFTDEELYNIYKL